MDACSVEGCARGSPLTKGMCSMHYLRQWRTGNAGPAEPLRVAPTAAPGELRCQICSVLVPKNRRRLGLCELHYYALREHGNAAWKPTRKRS